MRFIKPISVLAAIAALVGCSHQATPLSTVAMPGSPVHVAAVEDDVQQAKDLITKKFTEARTQVESVQVTATAVARVYTFVCEYRRKEFGQMCAYEAKGQLDVASEKLTTSHRVRLCVGVAEN
jgi:hypothetical protein